MSLKSMLGLDWFDLVLHLGITGVLVAAAINGFPKPSEGETTASLIATVSLVLLGVRRHFAVRKLGKPGNTTGEMAAERLSELEQRVADLEGVDARVAELEERLDFTERLLARAGERGDLVERKSP